MGGGLRVRDFAAIEHMMRRATKLLDSIYENPQAKRIQLSAAQKEDMHALGLAGRRRPRS